MVMFHVLGLSLIKISSFVLQVNRLVVESRSEMRRVKEEAAYWYTGSVCLGSMYQCVFRNHGTWLVVSCAVSVSLGVGSRDLACNVTDFGLSFVSMYQCISVLACSVSRTLYSYYLIK